MHSLDHVRWVGGGSGAGKTTLSRLVAERVGAHLYSTDATIAAHSDRLGPARAPLLERFRHMDMDERWLRRDPGTMYRSFPWFHGEGFELVLEDLRRLPDDRPILVEGFRLLPHLVRPLLSETCHAVWLLPTPAFRAAAFEQRPEPEAFWLRTSDPARALTTVLQRDRLFTEELARTCARAGVGVVQVDGSRAVDDMAAEMATRFGLSSGAGTTRDGAGTPGGR